MGTGYTRNDTGNNIADGNVINASDLDGEYNAIEAAFDASTGHTHDGTSAEGAPIEVAGPAQDLVITATEVKPKTDNTLDLGTNTLEFKDLYLDGTANIDSLVADTADINGGTIDSTTIGGSTPAAGSFTTVSATGDVDIADKIVHTGDTNTAIRFPSADTVTFETSGSEAMRIDSSGNVLVAKSDLSLGTTGHLFGNTGYAFHTRSNAEVLYLNRNTSDGNIVLFAKDATTVGSIGTFGGAIYIASPDGADAGLRVGNGIVVPATTTGALRDDAIDLGSASARWQDLYLSGGVYLGGTGAANYLDDYEEGTWTPAPHSNFGASFTNAEGVYTKIGNVVYIGCYFVYTGAASSGEAELSGLPFTVRNDIVSSSVDGQALGFSTGYSIFYIRGGTDRLVVEIAKPIQGSWSTGSSFRIHGWYRTDS